MPSWHSRPAGPRVQRQGTGCAAGPPLHAEQNSPDGTGPDPIRGIPCKHGVRCRSERQGEVGPPRGGGGRGLLLRLGGSRVARSDWVRAHGQSAGRWPVWRRRRGTQNRRTSSRPLQLSHSLPPPPAPRNRCVSLTGSELHQHKQADSGPISCPDGSRSSCVSKRGGLWGTAVSPTRNRRGIIITVSLI